VIARAPNRAIPAHQKDLISPAHCNTLNLGFGHPTATIYSTAPILLLHPIQSTNSTIKPIASKIHESAKQTPSLDFRTEATVSTDCASVQLIMLAFKVESWIWYGLVLFISFSRLYVLTAFALPTPLGSRDADNRPIKVFPGAWLSALSQNSKRTSM
jgi:hypothetical protein